MSYKIYSGHGNFRGNVCRIAAEFAKVNYEFVNVDWADIKGDAHLARHPLGKIPVLETPEGFLYETLAIIKFFARQANLMGNSNFEQAQVNQWLEYANSTFTKVLLGPLFMNLGRREFNEEEYATQRQALLEQITYINNYLNHHTYLAGEQLSIADIFLFCLVQPVFSTILDENLRKPNFSITRWYKHVASFAPVKLFYRQAFLIKTANITVKAAKKDAKKEGGKKQQQQPKKQQPKKEEPKKEEKPPKPAGNPLDNLPPTNFNFFDFKTMIVNSKDKKAAVQSFWEQYDPAGFSIWHVKYDRYEGEGEKLYLTSNLKDNTLQRLDKFRKYVFGTFGVYGEEGNYNIEGCWVWRGTEIPQEIKDLANYDYHFWNKLDHTKEADRNLLTEFWTGLTEDESVANGQVARDVTLLK